KVCAPSLSAAVVNGVEHAANAAASTRHSNVPVSVEENPNVGVLSPVAPAGPVSIVVFGAVRSITIVCVAGVASVLPAASVARTLTVCEPAARAVVVNGVVQLANAPLSTWHSNVEPPSEELKPIVGVVSLVGLGAGAVIVVFGAVRSI